MAHMSGEGLATRAASGESFTLSARDRSLDELLTIAAAAARAKARVELTGTRRKSLEELVRIAVTGGDSVVFGIDWDERRVAPTRTRRWWLSRRTA